MIQLFFVLLEAFVVFDLLIEPFEEFMFGVLAEVTFLAVFRHSRGEETFVDTVSRFGDQRTLFVLLIVYQTAFRC